MPENPEKSVKKRKKRRATTRRNPPAPAPQPTVELTKAQQYYIQGNMEVLGPAQLAKDLSLPVEAVRDYIKGLRQNVAAARANRLLQRPARGVVAMTEAASMVADDIRKGDAITQADINKAAASGNYELAADLVRRREEQKSDPAATKMARLGDRIHFIRGPEYQPPVDRGGKGAPPVPPVH